MALLYIKALHIIFVVTWFAGLFYIVRLFIYHVEAEEKPETEKNILQNQYKIMERRLWNIITAPSMILTVATGLYIAYEMHFFRMGWLHLKILLVILLMVYHFICLRILKRLLKDEIVYTSTNLRLWNEVATLLLVAIVFLVELKNSMSLVWGLGGLIVLAIIMMLAVRLYKKRRGRIKSEN